MSKPFGEHIVSTQTLIISTNITVNCMEFFNVVECKHMDKSPIKNKNKMLVDQEEKLEDGDIVFVQYKRNYKGTHFKKKNDKYFLNSVTIIIKIDNKFINVKVSNKGKLQITGCNKYEYSVQILEFFWSMCRTESFKECWSFTVPSLSFEAIIVPVMSNINFSIGFNINRTVLHDIINNQTAHISILEPSDGYVGVNIKIPSDKEKIEDIEVDKYVYTSDHTNPYIFTRTKERIKYMEYISTLSPKEQKKKLTKSYMNTFLVFYSGKVIMSGGISFINRKAAYEEFMDIANHYKDKLIN